MSTVINMDSIVSKENWTFIQIASVLDNQSGRILDVKDHYCNVTSINVGTEQSRQQA